LTILKPSAHANTSKFGTVKSEIHILRIPWPYCATRLASLWV